MNAPRDVCWQCRRPRLVCYCAHIPELHTQTRLVFLQHLRERRMPIGTARMAHLALPNSEFHVGIEFADNARVQSLPDEPGTFLLFPSEGAREITELAPGELKTLVVVDGTWPLAKKLIRINPMLQRLPRVAFTPERPGNYRIRKEPAEHCLSTIEAVSEVLGQLEGDPERFRQMLRAFDAMVDRQIEFVQNRTGPGRHKRIKGTRLTAAERVSMELGEQRDALVLAYAESNGALVDGERHHEIIHVIAERPGSGEKLDLLVRPTRPLEPAAHEHAELTVDEIEGGLTIDEAREKFLAFLGDGVIAGWGPFPLMLVRTLAPEHPHIDLRERAIRILKAKPGGLEEAAVALSGTAPERGHGRASRRLSALKLIVERLLAAPQIAA